MKNKIFLALALIVAIVALVLSIVTLVNSSEDADVTEAVKEGVLGDCMLKSGEMPSTDFSTCDEHCGTRKVCVTTFLKRSGEIFPSECSSSISSNPNGMTSYQCLCC